MLLVRRRASVTAALLCTLTACTSTSAAVGGQLAAGAAISRIVDINTIAAKVDFNAVTFVRTAKLSAASGGGSGLTVKGTVAFHKANMGEYNIGFLDLKGSPFEVELLDNSGNVLLKASGKPIIKDGTDVVTALPDGRALPFTIELSVSANVAKAVKNVRINSGLLMKKQSCISFACSSGS